MVQQVAATAWAHPQSGTPGSDSRPPRRGDPLQERLGLPTSLIPLSYTSSRLPWISSSLLLTKGLTLSFVFIMSKQSRANATSSSSLP